MTNAYLNFGEITAFSASSAATYAPNVIELENAHYFAGTPSKAVFAAKAAVTGFKAALYSDDTTTPTTIVAQAPKGIDLAVGDIVELAIPATLGKYLRAGGSAGATSGKMDISIELGEPRD
jgi:hypothetical protein